MKQLDDTLSKISRHLMLQVNTIENVGLINGKMGIAIFFYHYANYSGNKLYSNFARELVDDIYTDINTDIPVNFEDGFCGIGWGILHLIEEHFVDANADETLCEIDKYIMDRDVRRIMDIALYTGLAGIAQYVVQHKNMDRIYMQELYQNMESKGYVNDEFEFVKSRLREIVNQDSQATHYTTKKVLQTLVTKAPNDLNSSPLNIYDLGIGNNGLAGIGLNIMLNVYGEN